MKKIMFCLGFVLVSACNIDEGVPVCDHQKLGGEKELIFFYEKGGFCIDSPVAVGSKRRLHLTRGEKKVKVSEVESDDRSVILGEGDEGVVVLEALRAGKVNLSITALDGTEQVVDNIDIEAKVADTTTLDRFNSACSGPPLFLLEGKHTMSFELARRGEALGGYGYYPFEIDSGEIDLDSVDPDYLHFTLGDEMPASRQVVVSSTIDAGKSIRNLISEKEITEASLDLVTDDSKERCFEIKSKAGDRNICRADPEFEVEIKNPSLCTRVKNEDGSDKNLVPYGANFCISRQTQGQCSLTIRLPNANDGKGFVFLAAPEIRIYK